MENNNTTKWVWGVAIAVIIIGLILIAKKQPDANLGTPDVAETASTPETPASSTPEIVTQKVSPAPVKTASVSVKKPTGNIVEYTSQGFRPFILEIKRGESVEFLNSSDKAMVIRSHDNNPENFYPGFSQEGGPLGRGGKFFFTFTLPGAWSYYNLNGNKEEGVIIVK